MGYGFDDFIKEYPPVDEKVEPLMRAAYDRYTAEAFFKLIHIDIFIRIGS